MTKHDQQWPKIIKNGSKISQKWPKIIKNKSKTFLPEENYLNFKDSGKIPDFLN